MEDDPGEAQRVIDMAKYLRLPLDNDDTQLETDIKSILNDQLNFKLAKEYIMAKQHLTSGYHILSEYTSAFSH